MSKVFTRGIIKWGIGNARDIETWNPKLRLVEQTPALAGYQKIDSTVVRWIYRYFSASPFGPYDILNRFTF
ncbi:hypothetical protein ATCCBAA256_24170 [Mycobacterium montefiorense]|nr:hypothetical protein ATCCBAA256_24170 [Mycobacterium montefiorense]